MYAARLVTVNHTRIDGCNSTRDPPHPDPLPRRRVLKKPPFTTPTLISGVVVASEEFALREREKGAAEDDERRDESAFAPKRPHGKTPAITSVKRRSWTPGTQLPSTLLGVNGLLFVYFNALPRGRGRNLC